MSDPCDICLRDEDDEPDLEMSCVCSECVEDAEKDREERHIAFISKLLSILDVVESTKEQVSAAHKLPHVVLRKKYAAAATMAQLVKDCLRAELPEALREPKKVTKKSGNKRSTKARTT